ncbi:MAG TPA: hypothetical protein VFQ88_08070 [Nevskiaceae bacterium]|nr:hypothetical protein [Nevskiaceae bacterium]
MKYAPVLNARAIETLIPHGGAMSLLDAVTFWDALNLYARASSHRDLNHPLRRHNRLSAIHLVEYAAQAMAVHGGLVARANQQCAKPGLLADVRDVRLLVERIDDITSDLEIRVTRLVAAASGWIYSFEVSANRRTLATGRVTIMMAASP